MALLTPDLIQTAFAEAGQKEAPPQVSPQGFVNFSEGYSPFYEIQLDSGQPQAKAVERKVQNYLFGQASLHAKAWQSAAIPPWYETMPGGYKRNALVIREVNGKVTIYRSLVDNNTATPETTPANWEYFKTMAEISSEVPFPAGGTTVDMTAAASTTTGGAAFNPLTLNRGTYIFESDAAAAATPNMPVDNEDGSTSAVAGVLTVKTPKVGSAVRMCTYADRKGNLFLLPQGSSSWVQASNYRILQGQKWNFIKTTGTAAAYVATIKPSPPTIVDGMEVRLDIHASNTGAATLNVNAAGARAIWSQNGAPLTGGELIAGRPVTVRWVAASNAWVIVSATTVQHGAAAVSDTQLPNWKQVKDYVAARQILWSEILNKPNVVVNYDEYATLGNLNVAIYGTGTPYPSINFMDQTATRFQWRYYPEYNELRCNTNAVNPIRVTQERVVFPTAPSAIAGYRSRRSAGGDLVLRDADDTVTHFSLNRDGPSDNVYMYATPDGQVAQLVWGVNRATQVQNFYKRPTFQGYVPWDTANLAMTGAIMAFGHSSPGGGWLFCDGSAVSRATYSDLFAKIGTTFGVGDGTTTFNLPDLRGLFVRGVDAGAGRDPNRVLGTVQTSAFASHSHTASSASAGTHTHTATVTTNGAHTHVASVSTDGLHTHTATVGSAGDHTHTTTVSTTGNHSHTGTAASAGAHTHTVSGTAAEAGAHSHSIDRATQVTGFTDMIYPGNTVSGSISTNVAGAHTHTVSATAASAGAHTHTISTDTVGNHTHTVTNSTTGAHTHTVSNANNGSHTHDVTNASAGDHTHTVTNADNGAHTHAITVNANGSTETRPVNIALHYFIHI